VHESMRYEVVRDRNWIIEMIYVFESCEPRLQGKFWAASLKFETSTRAEGDDKWPFSMRISDGSCWLNIAHSTAILRLCSFTSLYACICNFAVNYVSAIR